MYTAEVERGGGGGVVTVRFRLARPTFLFLEAADREKKRRLIFFTFLDATAAHGHGYMYSPSQILAASDALGFIFGCVSKSEHIRKGFTYSLCIWKSNAKAARLNRVLFCLLNIVCISTAATCIA